MYPYLYQSADLTVGSYGVMLALAYLVGRALYLSGLKRRIDEPLNFELLILPLLIFGVIGAKLMFILKNPDRASLFDLGSVLSGSGFSSQGALLAAILVVIIYSKYAKVQLHLLLDAAAPAALVAYAIARVGCLLAGDDCYGIDSDLPWAMAFPDGVAPTAPGQRVHPLPLYEIGYSLAIWGYLFWQQRRPTRPYQLFFTMMLLWGLSRFLVEFISTNPVKIWGMSGSQFGALLMFLSGVLFFLTPAHYLEKLANERAKKTG